MLSENTHLHQGSALHLVDRQSQNPFGGWVCRGDLAAIVEQIVAAGPIGTQALEDEASAARGEE